jgi:hypothetical protein
LGNQFARFVHELGKGGVYGCWVYFQAKAFLVHGFSLSPLSLYTL